LAIWLFDSSVMTVLLAFVFGLAAMVIVSLISRVGGQSPMLLLVLSGVVTGAFFSALVSLITYLADPEDRLPAIVYWLLGSFASANYDRVWIVLVPTLIGSLVIFGMRYRINILSLGNEEAQALGVKVEKARWLILIMVALIASATVAVAGVIGWVGLVVPHFARMLVGADHRLLIPASAIIGAGYLVIIDTLARSATTSEIPLGVLTALVGAPLFVWLLRKTQAGGWRNA
jgi:iron complex transport system permease protein